ncbi:MAG: hypothetical protein L3K18_05530 [Thermoplasmata archaeon]|nr:hypothetical protein [Thermoplasmata archaeon]MCI4356587.1 hypothetical protein [Thermoplasmata archaeon]
MRELVRDSIPNTMRRHQGHWLGAMALGTFGLVALMALILPVSAAVAPMTVMQTIKITAPYTGAVVSTSSSVSASGCGTSSLVTPAFFHWRTGDGGFSGSASSHTCATSASGYSSTYQSIYAEVPLVVLSGMNHITASWSIKADGGSSLHVGACAMPSGNNSSFSECYASASSSLYAYSYVIDATNGSYFLPTGNGSWGVSSGASYTQYCYSGNCSTYSSGAPGTFSVHAPAVWHFKAPGLVPSHSYFLEFSFYGQEYADEGAYGATLGHSYGSAWLNFGTFGNGAKLNSIVIT